MQSEIHSIIAKRVHEEGHKLRQDKVDPWLFMTTGKPFQVLNFYGKQINYQGVEFEGSPRDVFWGRYIEPFLEDIAERVITEIAREAIDRHLNLAEPMSEAETYLKQLVHSIYERMAEIDQNLRGSGSPNSVERYSVASQVYAMEQYIEQRASVEINASKRQRGLSGFYNRNPFLFWVIGTIIAVILGIIAA